MEEGRPVRKARFMPLGNEEDLPPILLLNKSDRQPPERTTSIESPDFDLPMEIYSIRARQRRVVFVSYKRRWIMILLFLLCSATNAIQWTQYTIISNIIEKYYGVTMLWVDGTGMIYLFLYLPVSFPASWFLDKYGLRFSTIFGMVGTSVGAWIKTFSADPDLFYVTFIGQIVSGIAQPFLLSLPARIAAVWFGYDQVSTACSLGVFGNQLGSALGFILPPLFVHDSDDLSHIGDELQIMYCSTAGYTTLLVILVLIFFEEAPPTPPSPTQAAVLECHTAAPFITSVLKLFKNKNYNLLIVSYGLIVGVFYGVQTMINPVVLKYYPGAELKVGQIGLCLSCTAMVGSVVGGIVLDRLHKFKQTALAVSVATAVALWLYTFTINTGHIEVVFMSASIYGCFISAYQLVGFEFAVELTHPEPEGTSVGLINASSQIFGLLFSFIYTVIFKAAGDIPANILMSVIVCVGALLTSIITSKTLDLKRHTSHKLYVTRTSM